MNGRLGLALRTAAVVLSVLAYVLISYYASNLPPEEGVRSALIALVPCFVIAVVVSWRTRHRYAWLAVCAGLAILAWRGIGAIGDHALWVYLAQHAGGNLSLALVFGSSLVGNREPVCSRVAAFTRGKLEPRIARYTRRLTLAWTVFFLAMTGVSVALFALTSAAVWSMFASVLTLPLVALMFVLEHVVRIRILPDVKHSSIFTAIRLFRRGMRNPATPIT